MSSLKDDESFNILYRGAIYMVSAYVAYNGEMSYSVWKDHRGMNVSKVGKTSLTLYTFDMMSQRTTYRMDLSKCSIADPESDQKTR
jgi:hypothetical protein